MKAIIVEIRNNLAAVLSDDGSMYRIQNHHYTVGQVIEMKKQLPRKLRKMVAWAAATAAFLLVCATSAWAYYTPYSYVSLDVNPSIEFTLNRFGVVLSANGVNPDGEEILSGLGDMQNMPIQEAIALTVQQISDEGYFDGETGGGIVVATSAEDEEAAEELADQLQDTIEQDTTENGDTVEVEAVSVGLERVQKARELGVTPGKLNLVEKLQASAQDPASVDIQLWLDKPVKEIMKAIKDNRKAAKSDIEEPDGTQTPAPTQPSTAPDATPAPSETPAAGITDQAEQQLKAQEREEERIRKEQEQAEKKAEQQQQQEEKKAEQQEKQQDKKSASGKKN